MDFVGITIDSYIRQHLENYPDTNERNLRNRLEDALTAFRKGVRCDCGNDIWVIGSASVGNSCVTCITGGTAQIKYLEIADALPKGQGPHRRRHVDGAQIAGLFSDDGGEIDTELTKKPSLCFTCIHHNDPAEEVLCVLTRYDQRNRSEFTCFAYRKF